MNLSDLVRALLSFDALMAGELVGVVTRGELLDAGAEGEASLRELLRRPALLIFEDSSLREAADRMVTEGVGRLVVVERAAPTRPTGILTRSDVLGAHRRRLEGTRHVHAHLSLGRLLRRGRSPRGERAAAQ